MLKYSFNCCFNSRDSIETLAKPIILSVIPPVSQSAFDCSGVQLRSAAACECVCECLFAALCLKHRL